MMAHNGIRHGINLHYGYYDSGDRPFLNQLRSGAVFWPDSGNVNPALHDANGYPTSVYGGGVRSFNWLVNSSRSGLTNRWVVKALTGSGTLAIGLRTATLVSGSWSGTTPRAVFDLPEDTEQPYTTIQVRITATGSPHLQDIILCHESHEALIDAGQIWNPDYLAKVGKAGILRMLNPQNGNGNSFVRYADLMPMSYHTWAGGRLRPDLWGGTTTNSGNDYSVTVAAVTELVHGQRAQWIWNADATSNTCTVNVSGLGVKPVLDLRDGPISYTNRRPKANYLCDAVYDAVLDGWIAATGSEETENRPAIPGWPIEAMLDLCKTVGADPYFLTPVLACDDPDMNFTTNLATTCKNYSALTAPWMRPYFEPDNENWNTHLTNGIRVMKAEQVLGGDTSAAQWYGRAASRIFQAIHDVYEGDTSKFRTVNASQAFNSPSAFANQFNSARYVTDTGNAGDAAGLWTTHCAIAPYVEKGISGSELTDLADEWANGATTPERKTEIVNEYAERMDWSGAVQTIINWRMWLDTNWPDVKLMLYEYNSITGLELPGTTNEIALGMAARYAPKMIEMNHRFLMRAANEGCIAAIAYRLTGRGNPAQQWALHTPDIYDTPQSLWTVLEESAAGKRLFTINCV